MANSVKSVNICGDVKILRFGHGLLISVKDRVISPGFYFHETSHNSEFTVLCAPHSLFIAATSTNLVFHTTEAAHGKLPNNIKLVGYYYNICSY